MCIFFQKFPITKHIPMILYETNIKQHTASDGILGSQVTVTGKSKLLELGISGAHCSIGMHTQSYRNVWRKQLGKQVAILGLF
jgi:hypothetical protein